MNKVKWLALTGVLMIITGLVLQCLTLKQERDDYYYKLVHKTHDKEVLEVKIYELSDEIMRLRWENEALWDNYYSNVSDYEGEYEYYE